MATNVALQPHAIAPSLGALTHSAPRDERINLFDLSPQEMVALFQHLDEKPFRATQVLKWIYHEGVTDFEAMTNLSKALRAKLADCCEIRPPAVVLEKPSSDCTRKWLIRLDSGNCIETVFIPETDRATVCISSQVGCALDCTFCATAQQGFNRNLSTAEIIGQVWQVHQQLGGGRCGNRRLTNVVLMGMGEPLLNFKNVIRAIDLMTDDLGFGFSKRRVTISTSGVVPYLYKLRDVCDVSLAVSLHAPNDALRDELVPINRKHPIASLLEACRHYIKDKPHRRITWEYVMLDGVNDTPAHAHELVQLIRDIPSKVNLIPFNPFPNTRYRRSSDAAIEHFRQILLAHNLTAITRKTRGDDIDAACGQLAGKVHDRSRREQRMARYEKPFVRA